MFQDLYRDTMRELRAPQDKIEEIITMTQNTEKKTGVRRPLRVAAVAAAAVALLTVGVSAANPQIGEWIETKITSITQISAFKSQMTLDNGMVVTGYSLPNASVERRDGRAILVVGDDEVDITDALLTDGEYSYEVRDESGVVGTVTVTGTPEAMHVFTSTAFDNGDVGVTYHVTSGEEAEKFLEGLKSGEADMIFSAGD